MGLAADPVASGGLFTRVNPTSPGNFQDTADVPGGAELQSNEGIVNMLLPEAIGEVAGLAEYFDPPVGGLLDGAGHMELDTRPTTAQEPHISEMAANDFTLSPSPTSPSTSVDSSFYSSPLMAPASPVLSDAGFVDMRLDGGRLFDTDEHVNSNHKHDFYMKGMELYNSHTLDGAKFDGAKFSGALGVLMAIIRETPEIVIRVLAEAFTMGGVREATAAAVYELIEKCGIDGFKDVYARMKAAQARPVQVGEAVQGSLRMGNGGSARREVRTIRVINSSRDRAVDEQPRRTLYKPRRNTISSRGTPCVNGITSSSPLVGIPRADGFTPSGDSSRTVSPAMLGETGSRLSSFTMPSTQDEDGSAPTCIERSAPTSQAAPLPTSPSATAAGEIASLSHMDSTGLAHMVLESTSASASSLFNTMPHPTQTSHAPPSHGASSQLHTGTSCASHSKQSCSQAATNARLVPQPIVRKDRKGGRPPLHPRRSILPSSASWKGASITSIISDSITDTTTSSSVTTAAPSRILPADPSFLDALEDSAPCNPLDLLETPTLPANLQLLPSLSSSSLTTLDSLHSAATTHASDVSLSSATGGSSSASFITTTTTTTTSSSTTTKSKKSNKRSRDVMQAPVADAMDVTGTADEDEAARAAKKANTVQMIKERYDHLLKKESKSATRYEGDAIVMLFTKSSKKTLKQVLKMEKLAVSGNKKQLLDRLSAHTWQS